MPLSSGQPAKHLSPLEWRRATRCTDIATPDASRQQPTHRFIVRRFDAKSSGHGRPPRNYATPPAVTPQRTETSRRRPVRRSAVARLRDVSGDYVTSYSYFKTSRRTTSHRIYTTTRRTPSSNRRPVLRVIVAPLRGISNDYAAPHPLFETPGRTSSHRTSAANRRISRSNHRSVLRVIVALFRGVSRDYAAS